MERNKENVLVAFEKGYRVKDGKVISPNGTERKFEKNKSTPSFKIRSGEKMVHIYVSRLLGYQKFGEQIFDENLYVYHANGNPMDNSYDNINIGTYVEAQMSKTVESRMNSALTATSKVKKHDHEKIIEMHKNGMSYKQIMQETGIKSKGTISFIVSGKK